MRIVIGNTVECNDKNVYSIVKREGAFFHGMKLTPFLDGMLKGPSQRLFKPNGQYAGGDRTKNVARVL